MWAKHVAMSLCALVVLALFFDNVVIKIRHFNRVKTTAWRNARELSEGKYSLPRRVFFFTDGSDEVDLIAANSGWTARIYNESTGRAYIDANCTFAAPAYDRVVPIAAKADIFRLCAMLHEGGLYLDDDLYPIFPLDTFALADAFGLLLVEDYASTNYWGGRDSNDLSVWQAFIGSAWQGHPFFQCALSTVVHNVLHHTTEKDVLFITGPHALRVCTEHYTFRFQVHANWPQAVAENRTHSVLVHKAFPTRGGRGRHYSKFKVRDMFEK